LLSFPPFFLFPENVTHSVYAETFFPPPTEFFHFPMPGKVFFQRKGRTRNSKDFMLQHHDARTPATMGQTTTEPHSTATALTRAIARTPVTVGLGPTTAETPAKVWGYQKHGLRQEHGRQ
jgi:hypothetical protein